MESWLAYIAQNNKWKFMRHITGLIEQDTIEGVVEWEHISNKIYKYKESGIFKGKLFTKEYIFDFEKKKVYFLDEKLLAVTMV